MIHLKKQMKMSKEQQNPDMEPNKGRPTRPNEVSERNVKDVPEIDQQEMPDELHKEIHPERGTERIQDSMN